MKKIFFVHKIKKTQADMFLLGKGSSTTICEKLFESRIIRESDYSPNVLLFMLRKPSIKGYNSVINL